MYLISSCYLHTSFVSKIILASSSPYRRKLLERLGLAFEVIDPKVDETPRPGEPPEVLVERLAVAKARTVTQRRPGSLTIGSDQVAAQGASIIGKPRNHEQAVQQLRQMSGGVIKLYTGLALINADSGRVQSDVVTFTITFRHLSERQIDGYLRNAKPYDCTGSVRVEGLGIALLERLEGEDPNAVIGLPLIRLVQMLENENVKVL